MVERVDSLLFAKGPQMGNKMFVQLFNGKNIHCGAWILQLLWGDWGGWGRGCKGLVRRVGVDGFGEICNPDC